jgi:hypothetical protein
MRLNTFSLSTELVVFRFGASVFLSNSILCKNGWNGCYEILILANVGRNFG